MIFRIMKRRRKTQVKVGGESKTKSQNYFFVVGFSFCLVWRGFFCLKMEYRYFFQVHYTEIPMRTVVALLPEYQISLQLFLLLPISPCDLSSILQGRMWKDQSKSW